MAALLCCIMVNAHDFEVDGIYYNITSVEDLTVAVTYKGDSPYDYFNYYKGIVTIPSTVTYNSNIYKVTRIRDNAFFSCSSLTVLTIPESVTSIEDDAFGYCSSLTDITIPESSQLTSIGSRAFQNCSSLTSIIIPESVINIGDQAFRYCSSLAEITIPNNVTNIGEYAFSGTAWYKLQPNGMLYIGKVLYKYNGDMPKNTSIEVKEGIKSIAGAAFQFYDNLTSIIIPKSLESIGAYAFSDCSSLALITCQAVMPPTIDYDTFSGVNKSIPVYVPAGSVAIYQSTKGWNEFTNIVGVSPKEQSLILNQYGSATYCSEYALDFSEVEGLKAYAATGYKTSTGIVTLTRVMTSQPGMGLFLKGEPGEYVVPTLENTDENSLNMLVGLLENTELNGVSDDGLYYNYRYTIHDGDENPMFYRVDDGYTLGAGKAYLQIPTAWMPAEAKSISLRFDDEDGTTDIEEIESIDNGQQTTAVYDLMGRKVSTPRKGGVYIVNGKKIVW